MTEKDNENGKTQPIIPGDVVQRPILQRLQQAAQPVVPLELRRKTDAAQAISSMFMGHLIHAQFLGEHLDYPQCISCGAAHADQIEIDVYEDRLGGKVAARARLCIACWNRHQHILKHCIQVVP